MPEQIRTFWPVYLAKKNEGNAIKENIYFSRKLSGLNLEKFTGGLNLEKNPGWSILQV